MPSDRSRNSNPQGRQKSCSRCVKAKRKCDLQQPQCLRCIRQKLICNYPPQPGEIRSLNPISVSDSTLSDETPEDATLSLPLELDMTNMISDPEVELLDFDFSVPVTTLMDCNNALSNIECAREIDMPSSRVVNPSAKEFSNLLVSALFESRVGYSMEQWRLTPHMMVERNCTPWSHPKLYEEAMPRCMQDAYATCALFITRNKTNTNFILRHITSRAHELIEQMMPSESAEILARANALLLYQIMLLYSSEPRFHYQMQTLIPHLESVSETLYLVSQEFTPEDDPDNIPLYPSLVARTAWVSFIFQESCRRTLLAVCHAMSICHLILGKITSCAHHLSVGNRLTISSALWEAESPLDFAIAWNEKNHFLVKDLNFTEVLRSADASDVDVFGRMIMVGLMGVDDVKGWLHSKGGKL